MEHATNIGTFNNDQDVPDITKHFVEEYEPEWMWPDGSFRPNRPPFVLDPSKNGKTFDQILQEWEAELEEERKLESAACKEAGKEMKNTI